VTRCILIKSSVCSSGGVKLISGSRRITLDNTLDERLRLLEDRVRYVGVDGSYVSDISSTDAPGNQV
jgi:hypothetical protein